MKLVPITNVSDDDREVPSLERTILAGETVEVDAEIAGRAPKGDDQGEGLLAQPFFAVGKKADVDKKPDPSDDEENQS